MGAVALDARLEEAIAQQRAGRLAEAAGLYRDVLRVRPKHPVANHNLGVLTALWGEPAQSLPLFKTALDADPEQGVYWLSYARALLAAGQVQSAQRLLQAGQRGGLAGPAFDSLMRQAQASPAWAGSLEGLRALALEHDRAGRAADAVSVYRAALSIAPDDPSLLDHMGSAFAALGALDPAAAAFRRALEIDPEFAEAHFHLGSLLSESGAIAQGFEHFMRRAEIVSGKGGAPGGRPAKPEPPHKIKHDREQRDFLSGGRATSNDPPVSDMFHLEGGARLLGRAVNPANATQALAERWRAASPQVIVIDDFLTPEALTMLRRFCAGSTIWRRIYEAGYIGATPEDGFASPLLAQIAEEIQATYPEIFQRHAFRYLGAFKYDSEYSKGTNTHADNSAVNVNLYIAPDEANLDPESGGMEVWDVCAPDEVTMRRCNSDEAAVREFLESADAKSTIVPHAANRALIFHSALFHKTDRCNFKEGYLHKRINVSLLFGTFGAPTR